MEPAVCPETQLVEKLAEHPEVNYEALCEHCKGKDKLKVLVYERAGEKLVLTATTQPANGIQLSAAKLLRLLTACKDVRLSEECCLLLVSFVRDHSDAVDQAHVISLVAVLWNLATSARHRIVLINNNILNIVEKLLHTDNPLLHYELAGLLRNLSLDETFHEEFSTKYTLLHRCAKVISSCQYAEVTIALLSLFSNVSLSAAGRAMIDKAEFVELMFTSLYSDNPKILLYALSTIVNICFEPDNNGWVAKFFTPKVAAHLLVNTLIPNVKDTAYAIIEALSNDAVSPRARKSGYTSTNEKPADEGEAKENRKSDKRELKEKENVLLNASSLTLSSDSASAKTHVASSKHFLREYHLEDSISMHDIHLMKKIGEGQFGDVWYGKYASCPVAVKVIKKELVTSEALKSLDELKFMAKLKHPNVVLLMGACLNAHNQIMIVTEHASRGDLRMCLANSEMLILPNRLRAGLHIACGLSWLASHGIVHRDLKLPNLLVFEDWTVKVGDFGLSLQIKKGEIVDRFGGNIKYSAPEILRMRYNESEDVEYHYSEKTDVYSFGLILWELMSLKPLFTRPKQYAGKRGLATFVLEGNQPPLDKSWCNSLKNLLMCCWHTSPQKRPTFDAICSMWPVLTNDVLCPDPYGREVIKALWNEYPDPVSLDHWKRIFGETCLGDPHYLFNKKNAQQLKYLTALMCESSNEDLVSKERFSNVVGWFGPIDRGTSCVKFFARIKDLLSRKYFHGFVSESKIASELYKLQESKGVRCFAIRFSLNEVGGFYFSYLSEQIGKVVHEKISNRNGDIYVENYMETYDSWKRFVDAGLFRCKKGLPNGPFHDL